jgi:hypothetical protein
MGIAGDRRPVSVGDTKDMEQSGDRRPDGRLWGEARARVLRRYVALPKPTAEDAKQAARSIGVSVARLEVLARALRTLGRSSITLRRLKRDGRAVEDAIAASEGDLDLSGIRQRHRVEVERRVRIIGRYLRDGRNDRTTKEGYADEFGAGFENFQTAVTAWIVSRDPAKLPGTLRMTTGPTRLQTIDPAVDDAIAQAIEELGTDASPTALGRRVLAACHDMGLKPPTPYVVKDRLLAARSRPSGRRDATLCLDRVAVRLDARTVADRTLVLTMLFGSSSGTIFEHELTTAAPSAAIDAQVLVRSLRAADTGAGILEIDGPDETDWNALFAILRDDGVEVWTSTPRSLLSSRLARATFGARIDRLKFKRIDSRVLPRLRPAEAVSHEDREAVAAAIRRHNEGRLGRPMTLQPSGDADALAERLASAFPSPA